MSTQKKGGKSPQGGFQGLAQRLAASVGAATAAPTPPLEEVPSPMSGPGVLRQSALRALSAERDAATSKLADLEGKLAGSSLVVELDPVRVRHSRFANREQAALSTSDERFAELVASIAAVGKNETPILVRPVDGDPDVDYEIAFGHRRHGAVLHILDAIKKGTMDGPGPKLVGEVRSMSDADLLRAMWIENRERENLSAWELAHTLVMMEDAGKLSLRELERVTGISKSQIARFRTMYALPKVVLDAYGTDRRVVPIRHVDQLDEALKADQEAVLQRAAPLAKDQEQRGKVLAPALVLDRLLGVPERGTGANTSAGFEVLSREPGKITFGFPKPLSNEDTDALMKVVEKWLAKRVAP